MDEVVEAEPAGCRLEQQVGAAQLRRGGTGRASRPTRRARRRLQRDVGAGQLTDGAQRRAAGSLSRRYDQEKTDARSLAGSPLSKASNGKSASSSWTSAARENRGFSAARAPTTASASGSPPQRSTIRSTASGSRPARSAPTRAVTRARASSRRHGWSTSGRAASTAIRPGSWSRLVTTTTDAPPEGSNGRTCSASYASSSTMSRCRSATAPRNNPARSGSAAVGSSTPSVSRNPTQHVGRIAPHSGAVEASQADVQLTVREGRARPVRPPNGERGLAHSRHAGDDAGR